VEDLGGQSAPPQTTGPAVARHVLWRAVPNMKAHTCAWLDLTDG
jgi:hypothetical protein